MASQTADSSNVTIAVTRVTVNASSSEASPPRQHVRRRTPLTQPGRALNFESDLPSIADENFDSPVKPGTAHLSSHRPPFWTRKSTLFALFALFTTTWLSLLVLWWYARVNHGFSITFTANHLVWTYGPTAVVVLFVGIWRQVDLNIKSAQAWNVMRDGFAPASDTILLDYIFPLQIQSFLRALRVRHFVVAASIAAFSLLKVVLFVSTGLLVASQISVPSATPVSVDEIFNGTAFWLTQPPTNHLTAYPPYYMGPTGITFPNISRNSYYAYMADVQNNPHNFVDNTSLTTFPDISTSLQGDMNLTSITTDLGIFVPSITCEIANMQPFPPSNDTWKWSVNISSPTCPSFRNNEDDPQAQTAASIRFSQLNMDLFLNAAITKPVYIQRRINCSMAESVDNYTQFQEFDRLGYFDYRFGLFVVNMTIAEQQADGKYVDLQENNLIHNTAGVICKVDYHMSRGSVSLNLQNQTYSMAMDDNDDVNRQIDSLTPAELLEILLSITTKGFDENVASDFDGNIIFPAIQQALGSDSSPADFFNSQKLQSASQTALSGIAAQFMKESFLFPNSATQTGIGHWNETRISISTVSLWIMLGATALVSFLTLAIALPGTKAINAPTPESIAGYGAILASSCEFAELLLSVNNAPKRAWKRTLTHIHFRSCEGSRLEIEPSITSAAVKSGEEEEDMAFEHGEKRGWKPYACKWHAIPLIILLPMIVIIALELLFQISVRDEGLFAVSGNDSTLAYIVRYTSTTTAFIITTLFNTLDFAVAIFTPFSAMSYRSTSASRSLFTNLLGPLPPVALYSALAQRHLGASSSIIASLTGSLLSVVVPGLWVLQPSAQTHAIQASLNTYWNVSWSNSSGNDAGAAATLNAIQHGSQKQASTIWQDIVIPGIEDVGLAANDSMNLWGYARLTSESQSNYTMTVSVLRPKLNCTKMPAENTYALYTPPGARSPPTFIVSAWMDLPPQCVGWANSNYSSINITTQLSTDSGKHYFGSLHDIHIASGMDDRDYMNEVIGEPIFDPLPDNPAGCPSLSIQFGYTEGQPYGTSPTIPNMTTMICSQQMEEINATVTFTGNPSKMILDPANPPHLDEETAQLLTNGTVGIESFPYRIEPHFTVDLDGFNTPNGDGGASPYGLDEFFQVMVGGPKNNISLAALEDEQFLRDAVQRMYKAYMVNVINLNMRMPITDATGSNSSQTISCASDAATDETKVKVHIQGTMQASTQRLSIDRTSKLILQIMLGAMTFCAALTYLLVDMRDVLPRNPCSIAGTMSLLAGSSICKRDGGFFLPDATMSEKQLKEDGVFAGREYGLGWWLLDDDGADTNFHLVGSSSGFSNTLPAAVNQQYRVGNSSRRRFGIDVGVPDEYAVKRRRYRWLSGRKKTSVK